VGPMKMPYPLLWSIVLTLLLIGCRGISGLGQLGPAGGPTPVGWCGDPAICCRDPGVPNPGFNSACSSGKHTWSLSSAFDSTGFAITRDHAVWTATQPTGNVLYYVEYAGVCAVQPPPMTQIPLTGSAISQDAGDYGNGISLVFYDKAGTQDLKAISLPSLRSFIPLLSATSNQRQPAARNLDRSVPTAFVWVEADDIWACLGLRCAPSDVIRVTNTPEIERSPRIYGTKVVWENETLGVIAYADISVPGFTARGFDRGTQPDINADWIVYMKPVLAPDNCSWSTQFQVWAYGPLSGPTYQGPLHPQPYWGAANYISPRLTEDYVVFLADYIYQSKTVVVVYPLADISSTSGQLRELTDAGGYVTGTNVDIWQQPNGTLHALYRNFSGQAEMRCCLPR
jgi:hypothetical protein